MKKIILYIPILAITSCHPTKSELETQIKNKNDTIYILKSELSEKDDYIIELQDRLDRINDYTTQVQDGIDNYDLDDAQDGIESIESESEY